MSMDTGYEKDCKHGRLARVCDDCAHERELVEWDLRLCHMTADRDAYKKESEALREKLEGRDSDSLERLSKALEAAEHRSKQYLHSIEGLRHENSELKSVNASNSHLNTDLQLRCYKYAETNHEQSQKIIALKAELEQEKARKPADADRMGKFCVADDSDAVTENKAKELINQNHDIVGYILSQPSRTSTEKLAFVVGARVEWFERHDWFDKMRQRGDDAHKIIDLENALEKLKAETPYVLAAQWRDQCKVDRQNLEKEQKLRLELEKALDKIQPQIEDLQRKLSTQCEMTNKERAAHEVAHQRGLELVEELADFDKKANAKMKEITYHLDETHKETIKDILKESKRQDDALKARIKELERMIKNYDNPEKVIEAAIHADVGDEHCRVCGGRDHQCDENVIERSVKKDKEVYTITHDQVEKIRELQGERDAFKLDRDGYRQASLDWQRRAESAQQKVDESIRAITHQTKRISELEAQYVSLHKQYDVLVKQNEGTEDLFKKVSNERDSLIRERKLREPVLVDAEKLQKEVDALRLSRDSYKKSYENANLWLSEEKDKHKKDNTMAGVNQPRSEVEQLRVQLAGCGVVAHGGTRKEQLAAHDSYGWSPAYQSVLELRLRYDELRQAYDKLLPDYSRISNENAQLRRERDEWAELAGQRVVVLEAALKKLNLERFAYQDYDELIEEIESLPVMAPASTRQLVGSQEVVLNGAAYRIPIFSPPNNTCTPPAQNVHSTCASCSCKTGAPRAEGISFTLLRKEGDVETWEGRPIVTANGTKLSGAPTWPQYKAKRGPELAPEEVGNMMKGAELEAKEEGKIVVRKCALCGKEPLKLFYGWGCPDDDCANYRLDVSLELWNDNAETQTARKEKEEVKGE